MDQQNRGDLIKSVVILKNLAVKVFESKQVKKKRDDNTTASCVLVQKTDLSRPWREKKKKANC